MSRLLSEEEAQGKVAEVYADIKREFGSVPNFFKAQAAVDVIGSKLTGKERRSSCFLLGVSIARRES